MRANEMEGYRRRCPICGADFWIVAEWTYKKRKKGKWIYFCSWKCLNRYDAKQEYSEVK